MAFEICFIVTAGLIQKKFLHVKRTKSGFYFAFGSEGGNHYSYHADGNTHSVFNNRQVRTEDTKKTPLNQIKGAEPFISTDNNITDEVLDAYGLHELTTKQYDEIIYINNSETGMLRAQIWFVEPGKLHELPKLDMPNVQDSVFKQTTPWLVIRIYEQAVDRVADDVHQ